MEGRKAPSFSFSGSNKSSSALATATFFEHFLTFSICCEGIPQGSRNPEKHSIRVKELASVRKERGREREVEKEKGGGRQRERETETEREADRARKTEI